MDFQTSIATCFRKYVVFSGRASRSEFWFFNLFTFLVSIATYAISQDLNTAVSIAFLLPSWAVSIRRLHDLDHSGWWMLLVLLPIIGPLALIIWFCMDGTEGANRFGVRDQQ